MFIQPPVKTFVISSPLQGRLVKDGEPLANTQLIRTLEWNGNKEGSKEEVFTTDAQGYFHIPLFEVEMAMRGLEQFVAKTKIYINSVSEDNLLWYSPKMYEEIYGETGGPLQDLVCDISNPEVVTQDTPENILTRCRWSNMSDFVEM